MTTPKSQPEWAIELARDFDGFWRDGDLYCGNHGDNDCPWCLDRANKLAHILTAAHTRGWNEAIAEVESSIELVAELEHQQWMRWSYALMSALEVSAERMERWQKYHVPYSELDEASKDLDREWAAKVLAALVQELKKPEGEGK